MKLLPVAFLCAVGSLPFLLIGCGGSSSAAKSSYPVTHSGAVHKVEKGTVVGARQVKIDGRATNLGRIVGGTLGTAVGALSVPIESTTVSNTSIVPTPDGGVGISGTQSTSSNVHESRAAMAVGSAVGVLVGQKVEKMITSKRAQELTIAMDSGETVVIVQDFREPAFYENERVKVYTTRVGESVVYHTDEDPNMDPNTSAYIIGDESEVEEVDFEPVTW